MERIIVGDPSVFERAIAVLQNGGVIVIPTDTVYGLACDAMNENAIQRIFEIKMRSREKALPIFVSNTVMLEQVARVSPEMSAMLSQLWPGALTAVLLAQSTIPEILHRGTNAIGVRMPKYQFDLNLVEQFGGPLAVTSANISGKGSCIKIQDVINSFHGGIEPDLVVDAGDLPDSIASTVADFTKTPPVILREGPVLELDILALWNTYFNPLN